LHHVQAFATQENREDNQTFYCKKLTIKSSKIRQSKTPQRWLR